ncbi:MAG: Sua5/YciO/YrdC/YwlC family protein [Candidatus Gracilibacteria bacterium]|nr:Sua5/YciO/YrdC/YwlC family protein [Candidatus Gracilibacteria bacterium]
MTFIIPTDTCFGIGCRIDDVKSYHKIYKIKKRSYDKPLAIMVEDFDWLEENTDLNLEQIEFLKNYKRPFTILCECPKIKMLLDFEDSNFNYENNKIYEKIAFRVANTKLQKNLLKNNGPIFLTSANFSGEKEIYSMEEAKKQFEQYSKNIEFIGEGTWLNKNIKPSDIFQFNGSSTDILFLRQN